MTNTKELYNKKVKAQIQKKFNIKNVMAVPAVDKITVNAGVGKEYRNNSKVVDEMVEVITEITGQKPIITYSKKAISNFKLREGEPNGVKVTLRKDRMWTFLSKLIHLSLPRVKDFRGISRKSFDGNGNYSLGIIEHTIFPEIDTTKLSKIRSLQVVISTTAENDEQGLELLELLGMPFRKMQKSQ